MRYMNVILIASTILIFSGCSNKEEPETLEQSSNQDVHYEKLSNEKVNQHVANEAKEIIEQYEDVSAVLAVNTDEDLIIAIKIDQNDRFNLKNIEKEMKKKVTELFPEMTVTLSSDQKLHFELSKVEKEIAGNTISEKKLKKDIKKLKNLLKEET